MSGKPTNAQKCTGRSAKGGHCGAPPIRGTKRCVLHTPGVASAVGKLGGMRARQFDVSRLQQFPPPENATDMRKLLAVMVIEMRTGKIDPHLATRIAFVAGTFLRSSEQEDIKYVREELEALKRKVLGVTA